MFTVAEVVPLLRQEARLGGKPSELLRLLEIYSGGRHTILLMLAFRRAFLVPLSDLTLIGGWFSDGSGSITDARIDETLGPAIAATRPEWDGMTEPVLD